ncbi:hypothetical protein [Sulfurimonas sp.]
MTFLKFLFHLLSRVVVVFSVIALVVFLFWGFLYVVFYKVLGLE